MSCLNRINALFSAVPFPQALAELEEWLRRHNIRSDLKQDVRQAQDPTQPQTSKKSNDTRAVEVGGAGERDGAEGAVAGRDGHGEEGRSFVWATCGDWDLKTIFPRQCAKSGVSVPASMRQWCNLKIVYNSAQVP